MTEKLQGIPVEFLALTEGTRDEDGRAVVVLSVRGLNPDNPREPSNMILSASNAERLAEDLKEVLETWRRRRVIGAGPSDEPPLADFLNGPKGRTGDNDEPT